MTKSIGLTRENNEYLKIFPFPEKNESCKRAMLYHQANGFYNMFRLAREDCRINLDLLGPCLHVYHLSIELLLKSIIYSKKFENEKKWHIHDLMKLIEGAKDCSHSINEITENLDYMTLLKEISNCFITIRYAKGTISLSHNKKGEWDQKKPMEELWDMMSKIFNILESCFLCANITANA